LSAPVAAETLGERVGLLRHASRLLEGESRRLARIRGEHVAAGIVADTAVGLDMWRQELEAELLKDTRRVRVNGGRADPVQESRDEETTMKTQTNTTQPASELADTVARMVDKDRARRSRVTLDESRADAGDSKLPAGLTKEGDSIVPTSPGAYEKAVDRERRGRSRG
jgi:hypothetical protein